MTDLLQPEPRTLTVTYHPHRDGDRIAIQFDDGLTRQHHVLTVDPSTADYLASLLATATQSPRIGAAADQIRAKQRDQQP